MAQHFELHSTHPQRRLVARAAQMIRDGAVMVYPTDSCYAFGCSIGDKSALTRIRQIRQLGPDHHFSLVCRDLSEVAIYARVDNSQYRLMRSLTPGPYAFILPASREVPRRLQHPKRRSIGLRVPDHPVVQALLDELGEPLMSSTAQLSGDDLPLMDPDDILERVGSRIDLFLDVGAGGHQATSVVDLTGDVPAVVREGLGEVSGIAARA